MTASPELPATTDSAPSPTLAAGRLNLRQATFYGFAALGVPAVLATAGAYVVGGGNSAWLAQIVAMIAAGIIATAVVTFARKHLVSGSLMSYMRLELGQRAGILGGSALAVGYAGAITAYLSTVLYFAFGALQEIGVPPVPLPLQILLAGLVLAGCTVLQRRGVSVSVNVAIVLSMLVAPFVLFIMISALIHHGLDLVPQIQLKGFSLATFVPTVVIAFGSYIGFEGLTALAKETKNPTKTMPFVVYALVIALAASAFIATILTIPIMMEHIKEFYAGTSPLTIMARVGGVSWAGFPADLLMSVSLAGALLAYVNDSSRVIATSGQDGYLPRILARINPKHHTPAFAAQVMAAIAFVLMALFLLITGLGMYGVTLYFTGFIVYAWSVVYVGISIAALIIAWKRRAIGLVIAYVLVIAFLVGLAIYTAVSGTGIAAVFTWIVFGAIAALFVGSSLKLRRDAQRAAAVAPVAADVVAPANEQQVANV